MDVSGSMHGFPLETSKTLMTNLVSNLRPQDRFNFMAFEGAATVWSPTGSQPANPENLRKALAFVGQQSGGGGTNILSAMQKALALPRTEGMSRSFVIATDGYISVEPAVLDMVRKNLGDANMFAFGIGSSVNRFLIEGIAHAGMGEPFVVTKPEEAAAIAERFRQYIASPVLTQIKVAFKGFETYDVEPLSVPDVLADRPVICFGRWRGEAKGTVELIGASGSGRYHQSFNVADAQPSETNAALRYLWARHRIQLLGDYGGMGDAEAQKKGITELGLKYNLLTNYTSFIAIDSLVRNQTGSTEHLTQPLPLPEGVSNLAVGSANQPQAMASLAPMVYREAKVKRVTKTMEFEISRRKGDDKQEFLAAPTPPKKAPGVQPIGQVPQELKDQPAPFTLEIVEKLKNPTLASLLAGAPKGCVLELRIDAKGRVLSATFSSSFPTAAKALKIIEIWRFADWKETGVTIVRRVIHA